MIHNGLEYYEDNGTFTVSGISETQGTAHDTQPVQPLFAPQAVATLAPHAYAVPCTTDSITRIIGVAAAPCAGALIFEDNFDSFDANKWRIEQRFSGKPDYEFGFYMDSTDTVFVRNSHLTLGVVRMGKNFNASNLQFGPK